MNRKRVADFSDTDDVFATPAPPLRNVNPRRMTIATGALPLSTSTTVSSTPHSSVLRRRSPSGPGHHRQRKAADKDLAADAYNDYVTLLAHKLLSVRATARVRAEVDVQLSTVQLESKRLEEEVTNLHSRICETSYLGAAHALLSISTEQLLTLEGESVVKRSESFQMLDSNLNTQLNYVQCCNVKPVTTGKELAKVEDSFNELGNAFKEVDINMSINEEGTYTDNCLRDIVKSVPTINMQYKSLELKKLQGYHLLAQEFYFCSAVEKL